MSVNEFDVVKCVLHFTGAGAKDPALVFHVVPGGLNAQAVPDGEFANQVTKWLEDAVMPTIEQACSSQYATTLVDIYNETQEREMGSFPVIWQGMQPADQIAPAVAALTTYKTNRKKRTGKKFLPGLVEGALDGGFWDSSAFLALTNWVVQYLLGFALDGFEGSWVIPVVKEAATNVVSWITAGIVRGYAGSQRRRRLMST